MTTDDRVDMLEERLDKIERLLNQIRNIGIGIAIGMLVAGVIFGVVSLKEVKEFVK